MKGFDWSQALMNPLVIAGIRNNNPKFGEQLAGAAVENRAQQTQAMQKQEFENKQKDRVRALQEQEVLRQNFGDVDFANPAKAAEQLQAKGLDANQALTIIGKHQEFQNAKEGRDIQREGLGIQRGHLGIAQEELGLKRQEFGAKAKALEAQLANGGLDPTEKVKVEKELRAEVAKESGEFKLVKSAFDKVKEAATNPSPASDIALLYGYMKLLDPGSAVKENEYATAADAGSVPTRIWNQYNKAVSGEKLTPEQRKDFLGSSKGLYKTQVKTIKEVNSKYKELAGKYGASPENVVLFEPEEEPVADFQVDSQSAPGVGFSNVSPQDIDAELKRRGL